MAKKEIKELRRLSFEEFQNETIEVFKKINEEFIKNEITWFAHAGTLLGAIRNNKQIPWDDDIDMAMTASDFYSNRDKILEIVNKYNFRLVDRKDNLGMVLTKLICNEEVIVEYNGMDFIKSTFIDIFYFIPVKKRSNFRDYRWFIYNRIIFIFSDFWKPLPSYKMKKGVLVKESFFAHLFTFIGRIFISPILFLRIKEKRMLTKSVKKKNYDLFALNEGASNVHQYIRKDELLEWEFEGVKILIPGSYENDLKVKYGENWITPPPIEKQNPAHILKTPYKGK